MNTSVFLAQAFGLYFLIVSLAMLLKRTRFEEIVDDLIISPSGIFTIAVLTLIIGILLILVHNIWVADWRLIITLLSWIAFLGGIIRTFIPELIVKMAKKIHNASFYYTVTIVSLVLGGVLGYIGFFMRH